MFIFNNILSFPLFNLYYLRCQLQTNTRQTDSFNTFALNNAYYLGYFQYDAQENRGNVGKTDQNWKELHFNGRQS